MPIYAYKCESCGFAKDVLQKISDAQLIDCPTCSKATFKKQLTAAGFQLKGTGWYATDFKGGGTSAPVVAPAGDGAAPAPTESSKADKGTKTDTPAATPAAVTPTVTPTVSGS